MVEGPGPAQAREPARPRLPRKRFWAAFAAGVVLMAAFLPLMEFFFAGSARTTWPAYAIVLPLAVVAIALIGRSFWLAATGAFAGGAAAAFALAFTWWFVALSTFSCAVAPESASWEARPASLHMQLPDGGDYRGHQVTWTEPRSGLPLADPDLDARWGRWGLASVSWGNDEGGFNYYPLTASPGALLAIYPDLGAFEARRGDVATFLAGFGVDAARAMEVADALAVNATRSEFWGPSGAPYLEFRAAIPSSWGPQVAWDSFCCIAEAPSSIGSFGQAQLTRGLWAFLFDVETKSLAGDGFTLASDAEGRVEFAGLAMDSGKGKAYRQRVLDELGQLNLPQVDPETMHLGGSIC